MSLQKYVSAWMLDEEIRGKYKLDDKIVATCGCFDLLHIGHIKMLEQCKKYGDVLIVLVNSDESVKRLKGFYHPIIPLLQRVEILAALEYVDFVVAFQEDDPRVCLETMHKGGVKVDYYAKAGYKIEEIVESSIITKLHRGSVIMMEPIPGVSTTKIIQKILKMGGDEI